jgi:hypothetical protein
MILFKKYKHKISTEYRPLFHIFIQIILGHKWKIVISQIITLLPKEMAQ